MRVTPFSKDRRVTIYEPDAGHVAAHLVGDATGVFSSPPYNGSITARGVPQRSLRLEAEPAKGAA